jgi:hypothetical protein
MQLKKKIQIFSDKLFFYFIRFINIFLQVIINQFSTEELISFLQDKNLCLDEDDFKILCDQKINRYIFPLLTEKKFMADGMKYGPAMKLALEAKNLFLFVLIYF